MDGVHVGNGVVAGLQGWVKQSSTGEADGFQQGRESNCVLPKAMLSHLRGFKTGVEFQDSKRNSVGLEFSQGFEAG